MGNKYILLMTNNQQRRKFSMKIFKFQSSWFFFVLRYLANFRFESSPKGLNKARLDKAEPKYSTCPGHVVTTTRCSVISTFDVIIYDVVYEITRS